MPRTGKRSKTSLSRSQKMEVRKIAERVVDEEIEDKSTVKTDENVQLFHNKVLYEGKLIGTQIAQGVQDGDQSSGGTGLTTIRVGDQISLKNVNIRFWLSNKDDRPNVMYKGVLFWYPVGVAPSDTTVYKTQTNKMLDRYNNKVIRIIDQFIVKSTNNYAVDANNHEHSYLATLNKSYKNKKITFDNNGQVPKGSELGFALVGYDAYGTLQTDNIASCAINVQITFQDA
ncbi:MAG: putative capsid protein [Circoviridae sp.]|nr:MAG: putative capsid protein [Circoviridae sp.]